VDGVDLVDVVDEVAVRHAEAGGLAGGLGEVAQRGARDRRQRPREAEPAGQRDQSWAEPV
jgi:hypothetical protein